MTTIVLPRLLGTREKAESIVRSLELESDFAGSVEIAARAVKTATSSFVNAFVEELSDRGVREIRLLGASTTFAEAVEAQAASRDVKILTSVAA